MTRFGGSLNVVGGFLNIPTPFDGLMGFEVFEVFVTVDKNVLGLRDVLIPLETGGTGMETGIVGIDGLFT